MTRLHTHPGPGRATPDAISRRVRRLYSVRIFEDGFVVPWIKLIDAENDSEAIGVARSILPSKRRQLWDGHRLVAEFR